MTRTPPAASASSLALLQSEVAALLMEPGRLDAFARDPAAYARDAGLRGQHAALLAGIDLDTARRRHRYTRPATPPQNSENFAPENQHTST